MPVIYLLIASDQVKSPYIFLYRFNTPVLIILLRIALIGAAAACLWGVLHMIQKYRNRTEQAEIPEEIREEIIHPLPEDIPDCAESPESSPEDGKDPS